MSKPIVQIYRELYVPSNLQKHMLWVASIANQILDSWIGPFIDKTRLTRVLLLHDIGNIVKIEVTNELADSLGVTTDLLANYKETLIQRYGLDDHVISIGLSRQIGLRDDELELMNEKIFIRNEETMLSKNYERKIGAYADQRAAPDGVRPLVDRLMEAKGRYRDKPGSSMNNPKTDLLIDCAIQIEKQIMVFYSNSLQDINNQSVIPYIENLKEFEI
jgi:hypothetical protein